MIPGQLANATLHKERDTLDFRKESFEIVYHYYTDNTTGQRFTVDEIDHLNLTQVYNQYRSKHGIPFVDEIKSIREQYGLSASKMSDVLGLGTNVYRNYELGEIPSPSVGRLIQLAKNPEKFMDLLELSKNDLSVNEVDKIYKKLEGRLNSRNDDEELIKKRVLGEQGLSSFNGYRQADMERIGHMASFFSMEVKPNKTRLDKLFFLADFIHYSRSGFGVSGIAYESICRHPAPRYAGYIYDCLFSKSFIDVTIVDAGAVEMEQYTSHLPRTDEEKFEESEFRAMQDAISCAARFNADKFDGGRHKSAIDYTSAFYMDFNI
ncbi:helix-turn-helix domain-containing protein [Chitinophaga sp.]|uniref:helix-turn-helix domain-containing protein n=1 Tax=Chitinophaga sp. TaxID=1869181 RepID=UPI0031D7C9C1